MEKENDLLEKQFEGDDLLDFDLDLDDIIELDFDDESPEEDDIIELVDLVEKGPKAVESAEEDIVSLPEEKPGRVEGDRTLVLDDGERLSGEDLVPADLSDEAGSDLDFSFSELELTEEPGIPKDFVDVQPDVASGTAEEAIDLDLEPLLSDGELSEGLADVDLDTALEAGPGAEQPVESNFEFEEPISDDELLELVGENLEEGIKAGPGAEKTVEVEAPTTGYGELEERFSNDEISEEIVGQGLESGQEAGLDTRISVGLPVPSAGEIEEPGTFLREDERPKGLDIEAIQEEKTPGEGVITMEDTLVQEPAPIEQVPPAVGISEEKLEAIVKNVVKDVLERVARETMTAVAEKVARETMTSVAEKVIGEAIEALKRSLDTASN